MKSLYSIKQITDLFLRLTAKTVPSKAEKVFIDETLIPILKELKIVPVFDSVGNIIIEVGESETMFTAHLDDVSRQATVVNHVFKSQIDYDYRYIHTDGKTILGADNKAGVTVLLSLLRAGVPGTYAFFLSEEIGCVGSGAVAADYAGRLKRVISFDRKEYGSIITHQSYGRTCSDIFAEILSDELAKSGAIYDKDDGGIYTDSNSFAPYVAECTNLSVGMSNCHTEEEYIDIAYLTSLINALVNVKWEDLPAERDPKERESYKRHYGGHNHYRNTSWIDDDYYAANSNYMHDEYGSYYSGATGKSAKQTSAITDEYCECNWCGSEGWLENRVHSTEETVRLCVHCIDMGACSCCGQKFVTDENSIRYPDIYITDDGEAICGDCFQLPKYDELNCMAVLPDDYDECTVYEFPPTTAYRILQGELNIDTSTLFETSDDEQQ